MVTQSPRGQNIDRNDDSTDNITVLALAQWWPPRTWTSRLARAVLQADRLRDAAERSNGALRLVRTRRDLEALLTDRKPHGVVGGFLGLEGAHALEGDLANLDVLADAGFRMLAPTHFFDTAIGGSASGVGKGGLTPLGRAWVKKMEERHLLIDLAHASEATISEVTALATKPVVVSHTGVRGTCDNARNLSDDALRAVARTGGVIGIGFWSTAVCGSDVKSIAKAITYTVGLVGVEHVALGSDFDGTVTTPFDASGHAALTGALLAAGLDERQIALIAGENALRVLRATLPE